jgi:FkbM family methyltransferase
MSNQHKLQMKKNMKDWFITQPVQYFHDLLNDKFYDDVVFNKKENGYYVEIGVLDGWQHSQSIHFEYVKDWDGIIVEPTPQWLDKINKHRFCNICTNPISDKREKIKFVVRDFLAYSHIEDVEELYGPDDTIGSIDVDTITLYDLLEKYKAPTEIDFVAIDTEGYELRILKKYFEENDKYKINLISLEYSDCHQLNSFFDDKPYVRISNPYLNFIKMDYNNSKTLRLHTDNKFYNAAGEEYTGSICDVSNITWEHYFIHMDFLKNNTHLKKYILNSEDITKTFV